MALVLAEYFSVNRIVTSVANQQTTFQEISRFVVEQSFLSKWQIFKKDPRRALLLLPFAWSFLKPVDADIVICSSAGWAHGVPTTSRAKKLVYCHNPPRWLYQRDEYLIGHGIAAKSILTIIFPILRIWDRRSAKSADIYIANSTSVADRIKKVYGIDAHIIFPPVSISTEGERRPVPNLGRFFLSVGRPRGYKGANLLEEAFARMPDLTLAIVGSGESPPRKEGNIVRLGKVSEAELRWLYEHATALVSVSKEDFGLTPIEANAFGTPALVIRKGGFLDSTLEGISGAFIEGSGADAIIKAVRNFPVSWDKEVIRAHAKKFSPERFFKQICEVMSELSNKTT